MSKYGMREMFIQDMPGLHKHLYQFERLLEDFEPALFCHLNRRGVNPNLYATQWFLTLFAYRFPLELVLRVYDLVLSEGLGAILKFGLVLMQRNREALLEMSDMAQLCTFLKERIFDAYTDKQPSQKSILEAGFLDMFVQDATSVKITPEMLQQYTTEWEEKTRLEKERTEELENLRSHNTSLQQKIRRLEQHVEKTDMEHITAASEVIKLKMENDRLADENETLTTQVQELRTVVEHQTQEVEERMKGEIEAVTQANAVVHARNRELEEENEETTHALVLLKMEHANVTGEFEALQQRFSGLREMIGMK
jgi:DNA repair exonuclease SbcCD ATPase subunit